MTFMVGLVDCTLQISIIGAAFLPASSSSTGQTCLVARLEEAPLMSGQVVAMTRVSGKVQLLYIGNLLRKRPTFASSTLLMATPNTAFISAPQGSQNNPKYLENLNTISKSSTACLYTTPTPQSLPAQLIYIPLKAGSSFFSATTFPTPPVLLTVIKAAQTNIPKTTISMNCQFDIPSISSKSPQVGCPINLQIDSIIIAVPLAMKEQVLPDIPEEDMAQTQSMYEQLRKTTQKWFAPSHRRIFTSSPQPRHLTQSIPHEEKSKILALMREQVEIACSEYAARMGAVLKEQAKKIKLLGDLLLKNQLQLNRKNQIIADLTLYIEQRPDFYSEHLEVKARIGHSQLELKEMAGRLAVLQKKEFVAEKRHREQIQRIVAGSTKKVKEISQQFQERVDKLQKIVALNQPDSRTNLRRNNAEPALVKWVEGLSSEMQDLRQDVYSLRDKEYRYENYRLDQLESVLLNLKARLQCCEEKRASALKSSQTTLLSKTDSNYVPAKTRFLNKYKSLISSRGQRASSKSSSKSSGSESEVQQTLNQDNIQRLRKIITQMSMKTPVRLQIDQTGYAKLADTGMYLVDSLGDGFQFTPQELRSLTSQKIIST